MPDSGAPLPGDTFAGGAVYFFTWRNGALTRVGDAVDKAVGVRTGADGRLEFLGGTGDEHLAPTADVEVRVNIWLGLRGLYAGDVRVLTISQPLPTNQISPLPTRAEVQVGSVLWRAIRLGDLVDEAIQRVRHSAVLVQQQIDDEHLEHIASAEGRKGRKGPLPSVTAELAAEVVAPAYKSGGSRPVVAVQGALADAGLPGSGPGGEVTIDQARKAVVRARELGLLPPAEKRGGRR